MNKINKGGHFSMTKMGKNSMTIDSPQRVNLPLSLRY